MILYSNKEDKDLKSYRLENEEKFVLFKIKLSETFQIFWKIKNYKLLKITIILKANKIINQVKSI